MKKKILKIQKSQKPRKKNMLTASNEKHNGYIQINIQEKLKISSLDLIKEVEYLKDKLMNTTTTNYI